MQENITREAAQPIERSGYNNWSWFIPKIDQWKIPAKAPEQDLRSQILIPISFMFITLHSLVPLTILGMVF